MPAEHLQASRHTFLRAVKACTELYRLVDVEVAICHLLPC